MPPIYVKGGIWSNVEDEILKAAVSKYGLNQWARVSSLLARKTAKQAKARWKEWLDPSISKSSWTREEDEKLLHLVKLIPNQWRSIAPIVGRTPTQCVERYQKLLEDVDSAEASSTDLGLSGPGIEALPSSGGPASDIQIGEINLNPESKPARPDAVDMDEDEKEMLSEARARLANTQGKKAKRKARERMLEDSRRIAVLQKRRELKQAGINVSLTSQNKKRKKQFDYNEDIPHEHQPAGGFYDTMEEDQKNAIDNLKYARETQQRGTNNKEVDDKIAKAKRAREEEKRKRPEDEKASTTIEKVSKIFDTDEYESKRRKLQLPQPKVSSSELEGIIKAESESSKLKEKFGSDSFSIVQDERKEKNVEFSETIDDRITRAAKELINREADKRNLFDAEIAPYDSAEDESTHKLEPKSVIKQKPSSKSSEQRKQIIRAKLSLLPKPKNIFEILSGDQQEGDDHLQIIANDEEIHDEGERLRNEEASISAELAKALLRRSQAVQKNLPIPKIFPETKFNKSTKSGVQDLVDQELLRLIRSDYFKMNNLRNEDVVENDLDEDTKVYVEKEIELELKSIGKEKLTRFQQSFMEHQIKSETVTLGFDQEISELLYDELMESVERSSKFEQRLVDEHMKHINAKKSLTAKTIQLHNDLREAEIEHFNYHRIYENEQIVMSQRTSVLQENIDILVEATESGQARYKQLLLRSVD